MNAPAKVERAVDIAPLRGFVTAFAGLLTGARREESILQSGSALLARLVSRDDWLPPEFAQPSPERYRQYLLHCDSAERFSVVSFVWGPGQSTPVHDHRVWGLIGVLRGAERIERYERTAAGLRQVGGSSLLRQGEVDAVSPRIGDIHRVSNGLSDAPSVSIHVYGGNIGAVERATYAEEDGREKPFTSGYANTLLPNLWDRSGH